MVSSKRCEYTSNVVLMLLWSHYWLAELVQTNGAISEWRQRSFSEASLALLFSLIDQPIGLHPVTLRQRVAMHLGLAWMLV